MENLSNCISISQIRFKILPISEWTFKRLRITFKILQIFAKSGHTVSYLMFPFCLLALHSFTFIGRLSSLSLCFFLSLSACSLVSLSRSLPVLYINQIYTLLASPLSLSHFSICISLSFFLSRLVHFYLSLSPPILYINQIYTHSLSLSFSL